MRTAQWIILLASIFVAIDARAEQLVDMVRDLNALQNRMVAGDAAARERSAQQFDLIERMFAKADPEILSEEGNMRAAIVYLLCGGASEKLRDLASTRRARNDLGALLDASLLYAAGDPGASEALMRFDARQYPASLGGHLALVQAGALIGADNARAIALLDLARLLMPGSLVEEAALRREISILDPSRDGEKLGLLAVRYAAKYASSPFARHFWSQLPNMAEAAPASATFSSRFDLVLNKAPASERINLYLARSRRALLAGNFGESERAIEMAERDVPDARSRRRIGVYHAALATLRDQQGVSALRGLEIADLPVEDAELVRLAMSVGAKLEAPSDEKVAPEEEKDELATMARRALAEADELLKRADRR
jgi:chemotaxis protein MotC